MNSRKREIKYIRERHLDTNRQQTNKQRCTRGNESKQTVVTAAHYPYKNEGGREVKILPVIVKDSGCFTIFPGIIVKPGLVLRRRRLFPLFTWKVTGALLNVFFLISTIRRAPIREPFSGIPSLEMNTTSFLARFVRRK
jgi:hypothetical protein